MKVRELREKTGLSQSKFAAYFGIPVQTIQGWERERRKPADYIVNMMERLLVAEKFPMLEQELEKKPEDV